MRKILIIGASKLQLPAILKAKEMGFFVGVVDYNPQAIGIKYADDYFNASTIDTNEILKIAKLFRPKGIMTLATDMPVRSIATVTQELNLPGISLESAVKSTDKGIMIETFKENGVEIPWFSILKNKEELESISKKISYPCIIKPVDNAGSRGVILVNEVIELSNAYNYSKAHSRNGIVIVEEYLTGQEVSVEVIALNGEIYILAITDKITTGPPHFVEMGHSQPSQLPELTQQKVKNLTIRAIKALGIKDGPAHVEIMVTPDGPKMIEVGARLGGDNITTHLVPLSTGIDMVKATLELAVGEIPNLTPKYNKGSAIMYIDVVPGIIQDIIGIEDAKKYPNVIEVVMTKSIGETVTSIQSSTDRVGYVVAQGNNSENAKSLCKLAISRVSVITI